MCEGIILLKPFGRLSRFVWPCEFAARSYDITRRIASKLWFISSFFPQSIAYIFPTDITAFFLILLFDTFNFNPRLNLSRTSNYLPMASSEPSTTLVKDVESDTTTLNGHTKTEAVEAQSPKPTGPPSPPNGGTRAWLQVLGAFFLNFNTWGLVNTFGTFQSEYSTGLLRDFSQSSIAWIGSLQAFLMLVVGVLCGRALDAGYFYVDITLGLFLEVFGMMSEFSWCDFT